jgi:hypothetical protein
VKKFYPFILVFSIPVVLFLMSNSSGSVGGKSGSIGDNGHTCTDCHSGTATDKFGWITTNVPSEGYTPGQTYTITATGTHPGVVKFGFELTVENNVGAKVGTLQIIEPARTHFTNSNHAITHTSAGNVPSGSTNTWTMNWVAPGNVDGPVGIYAAFNAANGNGNTSGDVIYKSNIFISRAAPAPELVGILPDNAIQGEVVSVQITGLNTTFSGSPNVFLSYSGNGLEVINASNVVVISSTLLSADFTVPSTASTGLWDLHVGSLVLANAFTVNLATGIADVGIEDVVLYPNPAVGQFFVENATGSEILIYNLVGELVQSLETASDNQRVDISGFTSGIYVVKIRSNGLEMTRKLLVN